MKRFCWSARLGLLAVLFSLTAGPATAEGDKDLAKESQNPIGNIISLPFENTTEFDVGTEDAIVNTFTLKPVYPVNVGEWNLINRAIAPIVYQEERFPGEGDEFGLGDLTLQVFASPAKPNKLIWGIGPVVILPTHTDDRFGTDAALPWARRHRPGQARQLAGRRLGAKFLLGRGRRRCQSFVVPILRQLQP